ncbi:hypothetical protein H0H87_010128 [Tephrocybe sp. NHM501043]|nr:hypothetical protein H0H87_010128 [Tephrocybe sp. NHM501043]
MALALTPFIAMCGFRPLPSIASHLRLQSDATGPLRSADDLTQGTYLPQLGARYTGEECDVMDLILRCNEQFISDIGTFCNFIRFKPGEAIFRGAGEPEQNTSSAWRTRITSFVRGSPPDCGTYPTASRRSRTPPFPRPSSSSRRPPSPLPLLPCYFHNTDTRVPEPTPEHTIRPFPLMVN